MGKSASAQRNWERRDPHAEQSARFERGKRKGKGKGGGTAMRGTSTDPEVEELKNKSVTLRGRAGNARETGSFRASYKREEKKKKPRGRVGREPRLIRGGGSLVLLVQKRWLTGKGIIPAKGATTASLQKRGTGGGCGVVGKGVGVVCVNRVPLWAA